MSERRKEEEGKGGDESGKEKKSRGEEAKRTKARLWVAGLGWLCLAGCADLTFGRQWHFH